jgi:formate dehydrogenase alpha subunit
MGAVDHQIIEVNPSHLPGTVNKSALCVRGHFAHDFLNSPNRLTHPSIRKDGQPTTVPWDEALEIIADRLLEIKTTEGPQSIALLGSSKCTNEENYIFQKIARLIIGTNSVDNLGYFSGMSLLRRLDEKTGGKCRVNPLDNLDKAEVIFILGADPTHSTPVVGYYLKRAAKQGVPLIVVDPRQTDLVNYSSIRLHIKPQTDLELINGLTALLYEKKGVDRSFVDRHTAGFPMLESGLISLDLERVCRITDLEMKALSETAELLKGKRIAIVIGNGILQQKNGIHCLEAVLNLLLMSGSLCAAGAGIYVLAKENNPIGAMDMGAAPDLLPGRQPIIDDAVRDTWEQRWKAKLPSDAGLNIFGMIEAAEKGSLKALYVMGENPLRTLPQPQRVKKALQNLDFLVVQDILKNETTDIADVILPAAAFCEKAGSFTNLEGRIQTFAGVVSPPGVARPDWEILDQLSAKLRVNESYDSLERIRTEIRMHVPMYTELKDDGQGWVADSAPADSPIPFSPVASLKDEPPDNDYPFTAILGSLRLHLGSGTRTMNSRRIFGFGLKGEVEISPEDGASLGLIDGDSVRVASEHGVIEREIRMDERIGQGHIFIPLAVNKNDVMNLVGLSDLSAPESSGVKTCPIRINKV